MYCVAGYGFWRVILFIILSLSATQTIGYLVLFCASYILFLLVNLGKPFSGTVLRIRNVYLESRILIFIHPEFRIPDLGSRIQQQHQKILLCPTIFCNHKCHKIINNFIFAQVKTINYSTLLFTQNFSQSYQKYGFGIQDPRSRIKKAPDSGSMDPQHCSGNLLVLPSCAPGILY
jgi:hypothetical protein